jgi:hypothetical protein
MSLDFQTMFPEFEGQENYRDLVYDFVNETVKQAVMSRDREIDHLRESLSLVAKQLLEMNAEKSQQKIGLLAHTGIAMVQAGMIQNYGYRPDFVLDHASEFLELAEKKLNHKSS